MSDVLTYYFDKKELGLGLNDSDYAAIGRLAIHWAFLESEIDEILSCLLERPDAWEFDDYLAIPFNKRAARLKSVLKVFVTDKGYYDRLIRLINRSTDLRAQRDSIVHGNPSRFGRKDGKILNQHTKSKANMDVRHYKITLENIDGLTLDIYEVHRELVELCWHTLKLGLPTPQP